MESTLANKITEVIFLGLPGSTHNYGGLSGDNVASGKNRGSLAHPKLAAKQVLGLARLLLSLGLRVAFLPPQLRPHMGELRKHFSGSDEEVFAQTLEQPPLLEAVSSSAAMWVANAATVTYSNDQLHLTVANLHTNLHRRIEAQDSYQTLQKIFTHIPRAHVHAPLPEDQRDEGAANHMRLAPNHSEVALDVFVYGTDGSAHDPVTARQTLSASEAIIHQHALSNKEAIIIKQSASAIRSGVFHNDVIAVSNESFLLVHEDAYALGTADIDYIQRSYQALTQQPLFVRIITNAELTLEEAVHTYFFNSQIITLPDGGMAMIAPEEVRELYDGKGMKLMQAMVDDPKNPITSVHIVDLRQSMKNGGGPACLRLRVPMDVEQLSALEKHSSVLMDESRIVQLEQAIEDIYPDDLYVSDINYALYQRCQKALQAIEHCLGFV